MFYVLDSEGILQWETNSQLSIPSGMSYTTVPPSSLMVRPKFDGNAWIDLGEEVHVPTYEENSFVERMWRDSELNRADIELNKVQDGMGTGTVSAWREYRCSLRDWPESPNFPDSTKRPIAPDA